MDSFAITDAGGRFKIVNDEVQVEQQLIRLWRYYLSYHYRSCDEDDSSQTSTQTFTISLNNWMTLIQHNLHSIT